MEGARTPEEERRTSAQEQNFPSPTLHGAYPVKACSIRTELRKLERRAKGSYGIQSLGPKRRGEGGGVKWSTRSGRSQSLTPEFYLACFYVLVLRVPKWHL